MSCVNTTNYPQKDELGKKKNRKKPNKKLADISPNSLKVFVVVHSVGRNVRVFGLDLVIVRYSGSMFRGIQPANGPVFLHSTGQIIQERFKSRVLSLVDHHPFPREPRVAIFVHFYGCSMN